MFIQFVAGNQKYALSGGSKCFEISVPVQKQNKETEEMEWVWVGKKFFSNIEAAINCILQLKLQRSEAESFTELLEEINKAKEELSGLFGVDFKPKVVAKENTKQVSTKGIASDEVRRKTTRGRPKKSVQPDEIAKPEKSKRGRKVEVKKSNKKTLLKRKK
jgi:hypothetical protein